MHGICVKFSLAKWAFFLEFFCAIFFERNLHQTHSAKILQFCAKQNITEFCAKFENLWVFLRMKCAKMRNLQRNKKITRNDFFLPLETLIQFIMLLKSILSMLKNYVKVGAEPIEDLICVSENWTGIKCTWRIPFNPIK